MSYNTRRSHKPLKTNKGQWIGLEIECYIPFKNLKIKKTYDKHNGLYEFKRKDACSALADLLKKHKIPNVTLKEDSSITSPDEDIFFEVEINILLTRKKYSPLKRLCRLLKKLNASVNNSCGLHVHLDCRDLGSEISSSTEWNSFLGRFEVKRYGIVFNKVMDRGENLEQVLPLMLKMVPYHRRDNDYCLAQMSEMSHQRHSAINMTAFKEHKTIEIRLHQATINFDKIKNWVEFLYFISRAKYKNSYHIANIKMLKKEFPKIPKTMVSYIQKSIRSAA